MILTSMQTRGLQKDYEYYKEWLKSAQPGSSLVYFVGDLCRSADLMTGHGREATKTRALLQEAFQEGEVHLFQRRLYPTDVFGFEYIVVKRRKDNVGS